jgi:hypothetical protein
MPKRTSLLIRCSPEDAAAIRERAFEDHRTVAGYLLHVLARSLWIEEKFTAGLNPSQVRLPVLDESLLGHGKRTAIHLRCSVEEANAIRLGAKRRRLSISAFVVFALRRFWNARKSVIDDAGLENVNPWLVSVRKGGIEPRES